MAGYSFRPGRSGGDAGAAVRGNGSTTTTLRVDPGGTRPRRRRNGGTERQHYRAGTETMARHEAAVKTTRDGRLPAPPAALYPCSREGCREDRTWPPDDLTWFDGRPETLDDNGDVEHFAAEAGWYCGECASELGIDAEGPALDAVLKSRGAPAGETDGSRAPACTDCAFHGANAKASTDGASRRLLEQTHGIRDGDCCHPTALIAHGTGEFDSAEGMRRTWCGHDGMLFTPWPRRQRRLRVEGRIERLGPKGPIGGMHAARVAIEPDGAVIDTTIGSSTIDKLGLKAGSAVGFTIAHRPNGGADTGEWTRR